MKVILIMKMSGNIQVMQQALAEHGLLGIGLSEENKLLEVLKRHQDTSLALVDISGFGAKAWRMCATLHERKIPFIVLSTPHEIGSEALSHGAASVLQKPVTKTALLQLVRALSSRDSQDIPSEKN